MADDDKSRSVDEAMAFLAAGGVIRETDPDQELVDRVTAEHGQDFVYDGIAGLSAVPEPALRASFAGIIKTDPSMLTDPAILVETKALKFGREVSKGIREAATITGKETRGESLGKLQAILKDTSGPYWTQKNHPIHAQVRMLFAKAYDD